VNPKTANWIRSNPKPITIGVLLWRPTRGGRCRRPSQTWTDEWTDILNDTMPLHDSAHRTQGLLSWYDSSLHLWQALN